MYKTFRSSLFIVIPVLLSACASKPAPSASANFSCEQHEAAAKELNQWAGGAFDRTYGADKDAKNALTQLFLIQEKAPFPYAGAFNKREAAFRENVLSAKGKNCDVAGYPASPIAEFEAGIAKLKAKEAH
ncbi:MAG: hypothetical protein ACN6OP_23825 [Pseudomonadales bacterium]